MSNILVTGANGQLGSEMRRLGMALEAIRKVAPEAIISVETCIVLDNTCEFCQFLNGFFGNHLSAIFYEIFCSTGKGICRSKFL